MKRLSILAQYATENPWDEWIDPVCAQYLGVERNQVSCGAPEGVQQALDEGFFIKASRAITSLLDKAGWKDKAPMLPVGWLGIRG